MPNKILSIALISVASVGALVCVIGIIKCLINDWKEQKTSKGNRGKKQC